MKTFHLGDILSITTGKLVSPSHIDGIYAVLEFMTGDPIATHQIPRAADECAPALLLQHPDLADVTVPAKFNGLEHVQAWLAEQVQRYGEWREVQPLAPEDHTSIDPISELRMMAPHMEIVPVVIDGGA